MDVFFIGIILCGHSHIKLNMCPCINGVHVRILIIFAYALIVIRLQLFEQQMCIESSSRTEGDENKHINLISDWLSFHSFKYTII